QAQRARATLGRALQVERTATECARLAGALEQTETALAAADPRGALADARRAVLARHYANFSRDAFGWLVAADPGVQALAADVVDTLRALRCADALRQRGSLLKTSAGYEIFVDQTSADALFALRRGKQLLLASLHVPIAAGESNVASSTLDAAGNLRIAFHRGAFTSLEVVQRAAAYAACAVNDIQADVIESFQLDAKQAQQRNSALQIVLEEPGDNPAFAVMVREQLHALNPRLCGRVQIVSHSRQPQPAAEPTYEAARYAAGARLNGGRAQRRRAASRLARSGHNMAAVQLDIAFEQVRLIQLRAGESLVEAGTAARFVYIPLRAGLMVMPLGGYQPFVAPAWAPLGNTGVIRGAQRNASIYATRDLTLLVIPEESYLNDWHRPYQQAELVARLEGACR
ncbi:hypothetical protein SE17_10385, partial [Kouleothrix aurantiaca]